MQTPINYLIENREVIMDAYYVNQKNPKKTWNSLDQRLPKLREVMSLNTFKQYLPIFMTINENLQFAEETELTNLRHRLKTKEIEIEKLQQQVNSYETQLSKLGQNQKTNIEGWTIRLTAKGYYNLCKSFKGKVESIYIGKILNDSEAKSKIEARLSKLREKGVI